MDSWLKSEHFLDADVTRTSHGVNPLTMGRGTPDQIRAYANTLATTILDPWRDLVGRIAINSWYRSIGVNLATKGDRNSAHLYGRAADCNPLDVSDQEAFIALVESKIPFDKAIFEERMRVDGTIQSWVHTQCAMEGTKSRRKVFHAKPGPDGAMIYTPVGIGTVRSYVFMTREA